MKRLPWLDSLKGIAILLIVAVHCGTDGLPRNIARFISRGAGWVQLFLLITVVLTMFSLKRLDEASADGVSIAPWQWWLKKLIRLAPLYYVALVVSALVTGGNQWWLGTEGHITVWNMAAHFLFVHGLFPHYADSVIAVEWYIGVIAQFMILAPLIYRYVNTMPRIITGFVASVLVAHFFFTIGCSLFAGVINDQELTVPYFSSFCLSASLPTIFLGVLVWKVLADYAENWDERKLVAAALYIAFAVLYNGMLRSENHLYCVHQNVLFAVIFVFLIVAMYAWKPPLIDNPVFRFLGRHSYGIYLFHMIFVSVVGKYGASSAMRFAVGGIGAMLLTLVLERVVERPVQGICLRALERSERK